MKKVGVFICWCGSNIAGTVDVERVRTEIEKYPGVVYATTYKYMCSDPGQKMIKDAIGKYGLERVVVAACSPTLHEPTFRSCLKEAGLNPYLLEVANIREQVSWVHKHSIEAATKKAVKVIRSMIAKAIYDEALEPVRVPVTRKAMVIGGGVAGIQAALDIAEAGFKTYLVESTPTIGGHMLRLSETFPTLDCSQCILTPKMVEAARHPNIELLTYSEVEDVSGYVGNFRVKVRQKPRYIDASRCTGCGECALVCPVKVPSEFEAGLAKRKAVYIPCPQAVPAIYTIDGTKCLKITKGTCGLCEKKCGPGAIDYNQKETVKEIDVGAIVVATGYDLYDKARLAEYGYGRHPDILDGFEFERLLSASGPTGGEIKRPSDGKVPEEIVFVACAGSRSTEEHLPYCSKICCMYTAKHAMLYRHKVHNGKPYVFYMDIRAGGKDYDEFTQRAMEEDGVLYIRGRVSRIFPEGDKLVVWGADTLTSRKIEIKADMVVLAMAMVPSRSSSDLFQKLKLARNEWGFASEAHPKLRPVECITSGYFLAGTVQGPKDIPEAVASGSGAAAKAIALLSKDELTHEPTIVGVVEELCSGCGLCVSVCPYQARKVVEEKSADVTRRVVRVNEVLCESCGSCSSACPQGCAQQRNLSDRQIFSMVNAVMMEE